ncbi:MAG TPA: hypothetical protein PKC72_13475 [Chitinophagaceae bacterium]|nr:hypothetical protein [Chitinophagaceae bacterium]
MLILYGLKFGKLICIDSYINVQMIPVYELPVCVNETVELSHSHFQHTWLQFMFKKLLFVDGRGIDLQMQCILV